MPHGLYQCDKCPAVFTQHYNLVKHQEAHALAGSLPPVDDNQESKIQEVKVLLTEMMLYIQYC